MKKIRLNLKTRLFLLISLLMILSMSSVSFLLLRNMKDIMYGEYEEKVMLLAREFSQKTAEGIVIEDRGILNRSIIQLSQIPDVEYVFVYKKSGLRLAQRINHEGIDDKPSPDGGLTSLKVDKYTVEKPHPHAMLDISVPVHYEDEIVGFVRVGSCFERIDKEIKRYILESSALVLVFILAGLILSFVFSRSFSRPINHLLKSVKKIGLGDLSHRVSIKNRDETGELARAFNQMVDRLAEADNQLKDYARELEKKVEERTFELKETNLRLEQDITKRREIEQALRVSKERYQMLFTHLPAGVIHFDEKGVILDLNNRFAEIMGTARENLTGFNMHDMSGNEELAQALEEALAGRPGYFENDYVSVFSGRRLFLKVVFRSIPDSQGNSPGGVGLFEDDTVRRRAEEEKMQLEEQLQRAQKMEAIGTLAGGVAHDLNNILSGLVTYPELILTELPDESPLKRSIAIIQKSGQKAAAIVQDLLTLARRGVTVREVVNLNDVISEFMESIEFGKIAEYHPNVDFEVKSSPYLSNIEGSPVHLSKCVMNLISNAAEAMPDGGEVIISTFNQYLDKPVRGYDHIKKGEYVVFSITDSGIGMSSPELARIFEPFYTKKEMGRSGTGLGMAVVWGTIKDHNGYIDVQSIKGKGTRFDIYFPSTLKKTDKANVQLSLEKFRGSEKILIVDDVEEQLHIGKLILERLGYDVIGVSSGEEAVEYLKSNSVDLVILDMIMDPGIDGLETYKRVIKYHPGQRAIIASGFSETERVRKAQELGVGAYLRKPYSMEKIGRAVRGELDTIKNVKEAE